MLNFQARTSVNLSSTKQLILIIALWLPSHTLLADELTSVLDRLAITDMLTQYSYRWDSKDAKGFSELFTEDGVMERWQDGTLVSNSVVNGKLAIYNYAKTSHQGRLADRQTRHHFSGIVFLELTADTAVTENMAMITHQTASDPVAVLSSSGIYRNTWQKTADGWRIKRRILVTDRFK